jgi:DNA polymerase-1
MAERTATNAPIQGTAADVIKLAIRYVDEDLEKSGLSGHTHLVLQVHDELVYEIKEDCIEKAKKVIKNAMETVFPRSFLKLAVDIPILVNSGSGKNLGEVK